MRGTLLRGTSVLMPLTNRLLRGYNQFEPKFHCFPEVHMDIAKYYTSLTLVLYNVLYSFNFLVSFTPTRVSLFLLLSSRKPAF